MTTTPSFIQYAKQHFDVDLPEGEAWACLDPMLLKTQDPLQVVSWLCNTYADHLRKNPSLESLARPLLFAIAVHGARKPIEDRAWFSYSSHLVGLWTRQGTRDMSSKEASKLAVPLLARLDTGGYECAAIADMLRASPALWEDMGDFFLNHPIKEKLYNEDEKSFEVHALIHRYRPHELSMDPQDEKHCYLKLCVEGESVKPVLNEMSRVLMPLHHHTRAWSIAATHCEKPGPGKWMELVPALSSLDINPNDKYSWELMEKLHGYKTRDASCTELIDALNRVHPNMEAAYTNLWPAVSTMFEKNAQYDAAVELWTNKPVGPEKLKLPSLGV